MRGGNSPAGELVGPLCQRPCHATNRCPIRHRVSMLCRPGEHSRGHAARGQRPLGLSRATTSTDLWLSAFVRRCRRKREKSWGLAAGESIACGNWRPIGNETLVASGGCTGIARQPACGVLIVRFVRDEAKAVAWVSSGHWAPTLHMDADPKEMWMIGGDDLGAFRRRIAYAWGKVKMDEKERNFRPQKKKKRLLKRRQ